MNDPHQPDQHILDIRNAYESMHEERMHHTSALSPGFNRGTGNGTTVGTTAPLSTEELKRALPRGVTIGQWSSKRRKRFFVRHGKPRATESFLTEETRNGFVEERFIHEYRLEAQRLQEFSLAGWREFQEFRARTGFAPLSDIETVWNQLKGTVHLNMTVADAVKRFLEFRDGEGLAQDSVRHTRTILHRFSLQLGSRKLTEISPDNIREWLAVLQKRLRLSSTTLRHHRKDVNTFFVRSIKESWALKNPCDAVTAPKIRPKDEISVLTLEATFRLFKANTGRPCVAKLALEAFAGLRCSSAARLKRKDLVFAECGIVLPESQIKTEKRHYVDGFPPNLWDWLKAANDDDLEKKNLSTYNLHKGQAFLRAQVENPGNVLRHSFCTFWLSAFKDAARLAVLLTHRSPSTLYQFYKGRGVSEAVGRAYFTITPANVLLTWEQFCIQNQLPCVEARKSPDPS